MIHPKLFSNVKREHTLSSLHGKAKLQYLFDYYKLPFVIICIVIYIVTYVLYGHFTKKENVLYLAYANVTIGDTLSEQLSDDYISYRNLDLKKNQIYTYNDLYVSSNPSDGNAQYAYISSTKILASIDSKQLDLIIMNQEAFNAFAQKKYLSDLNTLVPESLLNKNVSPYAIQISNTAFFQESGFSDDVYIGVIANSPRKEEALHYLEYLCK